MNDPFPHVSDDLKAQALAITLGKFYNHAALIQRLSIDDWLCVLTVIIDYEIHKNIRRYGELLPSPVLETEADPPVLASGLIARWKTDRELQDRFPEFIEYSEWVESMLEGRRPMESALLP